MDSPENPGSAGEGARTSGVGFSRNGNIVTLRMADDDWTSLLLMCGFALALAKDARQDPRLFHRWLGVINRLNAGNPNFTPYDIPTPKKEASDAGTR